MISWYVPALTVTVAPAALLVGSASSAPCTVQKGPDPSSATVSAERLLGAAAVVENRQAVAPVIENAPPPGGLMAAASTVTEYVCPYASALVFRYTTTELPSTK